MTVGSTENPNLRSTKKDILEAYEKLKRELGEKEKQTLNAEKKIEEKRKQTVVRKADELAHENIADKISSLKGDSNNILNDLLEKLDNAVKEYSNIDEALKLKESELKEIYEIERSALTLASLIEAYNRKNVKSYLNATNKPPALRSLVEEMREVEGSMGIFSDQILTAKSWYHGLDAETAENAMKEMIEKVIKGQGKFEEIVGLAVRKMQQTVDGY